MNLRTYDQSSEMLPPGWNEPKRSYNIRYILSDGPIYILLASLSEDVLIVKILVGVFRIDILIMFAILLLL